MSYNLELILIVGAGPMAVAYAQVLKEQQIPFIVIGRGEISALKFREQINVEVKTGGLKIFLQQNKVPRKAIVATGVESLEENTLLLLQAGCTNILVEKPGALNYQGIKRMADFTHKIMGNVFIAYNRRFYASVEKARQIIASDEGLRQVYFEFTEWSHIIDPLKKAPGVKEHWFLANSTHVVDLAFYFAGFPSNWNCWTSGGNSWHPNATQFVGSGITKQGILFTYNADWEGPGRWGVELVTKYHRLYLKPIEQLFIQKIGSVSIEPVALEDEIDKTFKPGLQKQVLNWINGQVKNLCSIKDQLTAMEYYYKMAGYKDEQ